MGKQKTVKFLGMDGEGVTVSEAKRDAQAKIEAAMKGSYSPVVIKFRGMVGIAWREPLCWCYKVVHPDSEEGEQGPGCSVCKGKEAAVSEMRAHMAQLGWKHEEGLTVSPLLVDEDESVQREFLRLCRWQLAARHARDTLGMTDSGKIHTWASTHDREFGDIP